MTNRMKGVIALIIGSLMGMFCLQAYYAWQVYQQHSLTLQAEMDAAMLAAISKAQKDRAARINALFEADLRNPELVTIGFERDEDGPKIVTRDPETGYKHLSITYQLTPESDTSHAGIIAYVLQRNRAFMEEGSFMYWSPKVADRLEDYMKHTYISPAFLTEKLGTELKAHNIEGEFRLDLGMGETDNLDTENGELRSTASGLTVKDYDYVALVIPHPGFEILRRMGVILGVTALVLGLIILSFGALWVILHRQKKLSDLKDDFIDNVTHELLTPISTLKLALETLNKDPGMQHSPYLDISNQQTQRIAEVVDHILQVSFVEEEKAGLSFETVELVEAVQEVATYHRTTAQKPLSLTLQLPFEVEVWTDRHHLINILHNVIGNAVKYGRELNPEVSLSLRTEGERAILQICDNGAGIPVADQEKIFEKFHRVHTGGTHDVKGLGIGLYYTRSILQQLGGEIQLTQSSREGSCFEISLPIAQTPAL